ncbi:MULTISPECIES: RluA family pseudouridine synthase [unclassified Ruminococcus]|uniref:RluA family pseudouridine synthase n=1 Tax=unclassified Ruminococcus TaxID=2608920 RepID=UPI0021089169|nr:MULTISPECIES: RluA family pseudouridine synthase [unclassified Ruminococcus]MCQ4023134.1 RluA family pseudouridine synthase [Ruminococcus sp. zg-924]MCQ4115095.1 RluA family pseudouridine synthase [Ruminococcus sp. zg-921]
MQQLDFLCDDTAVGVRLDKFLSQQIPDRTRSFLSKLIEDGQVLISGKVQTKNYKLRIGDSVTVTIPDPVDVSAQPENIPLDIVYEDDDLIVVNKPKGMVVHPAPGNYSGTLVNALLYHCKDSLSGINGELRPGIVHRIDKNTSGLLIVAKNDNSHKHLASQIKEHSFTREYMAVVCGGISEHGTVDAPIGRHHIDRKRMTVTDKNSKNAVTHYFVKKQYNGYTHIICRLETGRTHQIRVHMSYIGHPVAGDDVYGGVRRDNEKYLVGQCLHAYKIGFVHPSSGKYLEFQSPMPQYFERFVSYLEKKEK